MGRRSKKKFVDKKSAQVFHVVHRSQMDPDYGKEGVSGLVLAPANEVARDALNGDSRMSGGADARRGNHPDFTLLGDQYDANGLKCDDGYDYSKHLRSMGGGAFIGVNGKVCNSNAEILNRAVLPDEVLGSEEAGRHRNAMEAVALDDRNMPYDVRAALQGLDGADDGEGDFEELLDDFVVEAAKKPEGPEEVAFDFDAHCAALIAKARLRGQQHDHIKASKLNPDEKVGLFGGEIPDSDDSDSDWEFSSEEEQKSGGGEANSSLSSTGDADSSFVEEIEAPTRMIDEHFDVIIGQYDDEELGELTDDERVEGLLDCDGEMMNDLFDDFLGEHGDEISRYHAKPFKEGCDIAQEVGEDATGDMRDMNPTEQKAKISKTTQIVKELLANANDKDGNGDGPAWDEEEIGLDDEALEMDAMFPAKVVPQWDCETIVSTYSNLDNHPSVISASTTRSKIRLSRKTGLPLAMSQSTRPGTRNSRSGNDGTANGAGFMLQADPRQHTFAEEDDEESSASEEEFQTVIDTSAKRDKGETREEKRARKKAVKMERAKRRAAKKSNTGFFKEESKKMKKSAVGKGKGLRLFKY